MKQNQPNIILAGLIGVLCLSQSSLAADLMDHWTWSNPIPTGETLRSVAYGNGTWVAVGDQTIIRSLDGIAWAHAAGETNPSPSSVVFGGGQFVAVGAKTILTSPDGQNWTARAGNSLFGNWQIAYGGGRYVATTTDGYTLSSSNGVDWVAVSTGGAFYAGAVAFGQGLFVAVCCNGTIVTSSDGQSWTARNSGTTQPLQGITFGNGKFVTAGDGVILTSPDGIVWTLRNAGVSDSFRAPAFANGEFVVVAGSFPTSILLRSTDGITWNPASSYSASLRVGDLQGLSGANGQFIGVGNSGTIATSADGDQWTLRTLGPQVGVGGVTYGNGLFVGVGSSYDLNSDIITSPDGVNWTEHNSGVPLGDAE